MEREQKDMLKLMTMKVHSLPTLSSLGIPPQLEQPLTWQGTTCMPPSGKRVPPAKRGWPSSSSLGLEKDLDAPHLRQLSPPAGVAVCDGIPQVDGCDDAEIDSQSDKSIDVSNEKINDQFGKDSQFGPFRAPQSMTGQCQLTKFAIELLSFTQTLADSSEILEMLY